MHSAFIYGNENGEIGNFTRSARNKYDISVDESHHHENCVACANIAVNGNFYVISNR